MIWASHRRSPRVAWRIRTMKLKRVLKWSTGILALVLVGIIAVAWFRSSNTCYEGERVTPATPIKAVVYCDYGSPDVLRVEDIEKPVPDDDQVLVRVRAAAINPLEWHFMR